MSGASQVQFQNTASQTAAAFGDYTRKCGFGKPSKMQPYAKVHELIKPWQVVAEFKRQNIE
ncbi:hypothetical protein HPP92_010011 [Vanilla planifolia]|uniref:Uncharacterized protein n=1 Tax=Vanilla planifolia TaxID=51239 RepID=A0A835V5A4_VANPL|nr:hypothetical protein HPP92_010011 [Vanilla planifolia]